LKDEFNRAPVLHFTTAFFTQALIAGNEDGCATGTTLDQQPVPMAVAQPGPVAGI
jgi:hypothetical protein